MQAHLMRISLPFVVKSFHSSSLARISMLVMSCDVSLVYMRSAPERTASSSIRSSSSREKKTPPTIMPAVTTPSERS
uniref:Secreted protein n=1 Tax=Steinernema glaseri TaxID=37863 RepID=A0A1I7Z1H2_9BILA